MWDSATTKVFVDASDVADVVEQLEPFIVEFERATAASACLLMALQLLRHQAPTGPEAATFLAYVGQYVIDQPRGVTH